MIKIKTKNEIEIMKKSGQIIAELFELFEKDVKPGVTTKELDRIAEEFIRKNGAVPSFKGYRVAPGIPDYPATICASINNEVVHGIPCLKTLKDGDIISVDVGAYLDGFHSDAARTFQVGNVSAEAKKLIDVTRQSFYEGIKNAIAGKRISDISSAIQDCVEKNGFSVVRDFVGHGIGRNVHEEPQIPNYKTGRRGERLHSGMALAIEPMVNAGGYQVKVLENKWTVVTVDGSLSAHYENTIIVTDEDPIIVTKFL